MEDYSFLDESDCDFIFTNRSNNHNRYQISVSKTSLTSVGKGKKRFESFLEPTEESSQHQVPQDPHSRLQYTNRGHNLSNRTSETSSLADSVSLEVSDSNYNSMVMSDLNDALNLPEWAYRTVPYIFPPIRFGSRSTVSSASRTYPLYGTVRFILRAGYGDSVRLDKMYGTVR